MARDDEAPAVRRAASGEGDGFVRSFVKSGFAVAAGGSGAGAVLGEVAPAAVDGARAEAIGREQQRRAVAYSRSRGQL